MHCEADLVVLVMSLLWRLVARARDTAFQDEHSHRSQRSASTVEKIAGRQLYPSQIITGHTMAEPPPDVITLSSDSEEDEDLKRAIALSLKDQETASEAGSETASEASDNPSIEKEVEASDDHVQNTDVPSATTGFLALDRKQMEKERLARIAKRSREESNHQRDDQVSEAPPSKKRIAEVSPAITTPGAAATAISIPTASSTANSTPSPKVPFPKGVVKRTWAYGYPRTSEDIKIEEIFQRSQLQLAILSSYQWDEEWLMSKVDMSQTKLLLVAYAADEAQVGPPSIVHVLHQRACRRRNNQTARS